MIPSTNKATFLLFSLALNLLAPTKARSSSRIVLTDEQYVNNLPTIAAPSIKNIVYVINSLSKNTNTLHVGCDAKDDEVPYANLMNPGDYFRWSFQLESGKTKVYDCLFQVNDVLRDEIVFDGDLVRYCRSNNGIICVWSVKEDGLYISNHFPPTNLTKIYEAHW